MRNFNKSQFNVSTTTLPKLAEEIRALRSQYGTANGRLLSHIQMYGQNPSGNFRNAERTALCKECGNLLKNLHTLEGAFYAEFQ